MSLYTANTAQEIADKLEHIMKPDMALTALIHGGIAIATKDKKGYHPSNLKLPTSNYNEIQKLCDDANAILFPDREPKETAIIVLSSMRRY